MLLFEKELGQNIANALRLVVLEQKHAPTQSLLTQVEVMTAHSQTILSSSQNVMKAIAHLFVTMCQYVVVRVHTRNCS